ncbi:PREDICTED: pectinesterase-like [Nelumbo nucifera]|uniref:Pectinesterase n=2 Tax=Nelumbo nucifera TaxID=4432 RepID=A0A822Y6H8_NELNU|nr:PREDICTED: pectinesterase-like [Nelumbo nucifera]DAD27842.1 TPA_asm: hypothetical protein HUJ06_029310 [Nelumbo nucifera]
MPCNLFSSCYSTLLFSIILFFSLSSAQDPSLAPVTPENACNSTPYPDFCKSVLPRNGSANIYDYGRFSVRQSLSAATQISTLINQYLGSLLPLSTTVLEVLKDCQLLADLNVDFLLSSANSLSSTKPLLSLQVNDVQTFLSATLTNQQTCLDELQTFASAWSAKIGIYTPLSNGIKLYSVSLALFTRGWVHKNGKVKGRKLMFDDQEMGQHGRLPLIMSSHNRHIYDVSRRKLLQTTTPDVLVRDVVVVSQDGSGNFTSINDAIAAAPTNTKANKGYFLIYVVAGIYEEYVTIAKNKKNLMIIGDGIDQTVITGDRGVVDGWTTFNSATLAVVGQGFVAVNITVRNTAGAIKHQAVAVRNGADMSTFYSCSFEGYQDTLYTHSLRQFYRECDIYGTVDFVFGNAAAVFQDCNIYARLPMQGQFNALTAQGRTDPNQNTGISIHNCKIMAAPDLASSNGTTRSYLGRPWKEYSRTVYMQSFIDSFIDPTGWREWSGDFALSTLYYAEYSNTGPGAVTADRVTWPGYHEINDTDAADFTVSNFVVGDYWLPATGVPYSGGLL